jgi:DegV family protein with EDD domain
MAWKIVTDSGADISPDYAGTSEYTVVPFIIMTGAQEYIDNGSLPTKDLVERMAASEVGTKTACPPPQWFMDTFEGEEDVLVVTLSAELSGSYNSAVQAANLYLEEHPGKKLHVFNSRSACAGQTAVVGKVCELCAKGLSFDEVVAETDHFIAHITTLFVLENLDNLRKNGRLNQMQAIITGTLRIKLVMEGTPAGTIDKLGQAMTINSALSKLADAAAARAALVGTEGRTLFISHCCCEERALYVRNLLYKKTPFRTAVICRTRGLSTVYANNGGVVVAF